MTCIQILFSTLVNMNVQNDVHIEIYDINSNIFPHTGRGGRTPVFGSLPRIVKYLDALHGRLKSDTLVGGAQPLGVEEGGVLAIPQVVSCLTR